MKFNCMESYFISTYTSEIQFLIELIDQEMPVVADLYFIYLFIYFFMMKIRFLIGLYLSGSNTKQRVALDNNLHCVEKRL